MKNFVMLICVLFTITIPGCSGSNKTTSAKDANNGLESNAVQVIESTDYYKITKDGDLYYSYIYNANNEQVFEYGPSAKQMHIEMITDSLLKYSLQAGTGIQTQWSFYYNISEDVISETFYGVSDENKNLVAIVSSDKVMVRDIFDKNEFYCEIADFTEEFSESVTPIIEANLSQDNSEVSITYFSGDDFKELTEIFPLVK